MKKKYSGILFVLAIVFFVMIYPIATKRHLSRIVQAPSGMYMFDVYTFNTIDLETMKRLNTFYSYTFISNEEYIEIKRQISKYQFLAFFLGFLGLSCAISGVYQLSKKRKLDRTLKETETDQST
jgi:uncharacterized membrane protein YtjA (UPF0391 family)